MSQGNVDEFKSNDESDLDSIFQKKKPSLYDPRILVCNPAVMENYSKETVYTVKGLDRAGNFEVVRKCSEFDKLRTLFLTIWPGCYIPSLPPKAKTRAEERMRLLNNFVKRIAGIPYLYYSEEFQNFIKSHSSEIFSAIEKFSCEDVITKYSSSFSHLSGKDLNNETISKIAGFKIFMQKTHSAFSDFLKEKKNEPSKKEACEWMEFESREIEAYLEAINQREKYEIMKERVYEKQKSQTLELQKVLAGKITLNTLFMRKSKEEVVGDLEKQIEAV